MIAKLCSLILLSFVVVKAENIVMTEVFIIKIEPAMFNWTYEDDPNQYVYQPSLINSPDLPSWINYHYSLRHHAGFLYGVAPEKHPTHVTLEIIALNRKNYATKRYELPIYIIEKLNPAVNEVHLKIVNLNVEDMFDTDKIKTLKDVFGENLWKDSVPDLYVTFLASAVQLGARLPLNPNEGEGVVVRIGSRAHLSSELIKLQKDVKSLWKYTSCPRDFKRTTVERIFRDAGFVLDWCVFRLIEDTSSAMEQHSSTTVEKLSNLLNYWKSIERSDVPHRSYFHEFFVTIVLPIFIFLVFAVILSLILCLHHEGMEDEASEEFFDNIFHICIDYARSKTMDDISKHDASNYATIHRATQSLRSASIAKDKPCLSPQNNISRSNTNSPTSTVRGIHCRPSPPPYVRPKYKQDL